MSTHSSHITTGYQHDEKCIHCGAESPKSGHRLGLLSKLCPNIPKIYGYICHSGGCPGADITWENESKRYGITTIAYSFLNHIHEGLHPKILNQNELAEGYEQVKLASVRLNMKTDFLPMYTKNLLARNWFQVKNADAVFAIGKMKNPFMVDGGTGWTVQMAILNKKPVFVFEQNMSLWHQYDFENDIFSPYKDVPILTPNFAGIGTRDINENGIAAIKEILKINNEKTI